MIYRFARMAGIDTDRLEPAEADEVDTLLFRKHTDMPFDAADQERLDEIAAKADPPADPRPQAQKGAMRLVVVESPYAGDVEANVDYARAAVLDSLRRGEAPICSHLLYTQAGILRDEVPAERKLGIDAGLAWRVVAAGAVFYTDRGWSSGMLAARELYRVEGIPFEMRSIERGATPLIAADRPQVGA